MTGYKRHGWLLVLGLCLALLLAGGRHLAAAARDIDVAVEKKEPVGRRSGRNQ
jgi:hypothetical protein